MKLVSRGGHANDVLSTVAMDCIAVLADKIRLRVKSSRDPALVSAKGLDVDDSDNQVDLPVHVPIEEFGLQVMIASLSATKSDLLVPSALCAISKAIRLIEVWSFFANTFLIETQVGRYTRAKTVSLRFIFPRGLFYARRCKTLAIVCFIYLISSPPAMRRRVAFRFWRIPERL